MCIFISIILLKSDLYILRLLDYGGILDIYETVGQIIPLEKEEYTDLLVAFLLNEGKNYMIPSQDEIMEDRHKVLLPESLKRIVTKYKQDERVNQIKTMAKKQIMQKSMVIFSMMNI